MNKELFWLLTNEEIEAIQDTCDGLTTTLHRLGISGGQFRSLRTYKLLTTLQAVKALRDKGVLPSDSK